METQNKTLYSSTAQAYAYIATPEETEVRPYAVDSLCLHLLKFYYYYFRLYS